MYLKTRHLKWFHYFTLSTWVINADGVNQVRSSVLLWWFIFVNFLEIFGEGYFESLFVVLVKAVFLESVEGDGRLEDVLEIDKTEEVLSATHGGFSDQTDALEPWEGTKNI